MKRVFLTFVVIAELFLSACAGTNDWSFELPNDFAIWHINAQDIRIVYTGEQANIPNIVGFVKEFAMDERYVYVRMVMDIAKNNILLDETYDIIDTQKKVVYGPYTTLSELQKKASECETEIPEQWYCTSSNPNYSLTSEE